MKNPHARAAEKDLAAEAFPEDSATDKDRLKDVVTEVISDIGGLQILNLCCVMQRKRVTRLVELEQALGITVVGHKDIQLLAKLAGAIMNHHTESSETQKDPHERTREIEKLGPSTQKVSKLNPLDQMLMRQAATIVIDTIRKNIGALDEAKAAENEDFETAPGEKDLAAEAFPEDSATDKDLLKDVVTEVIRDVSSIQMLKLCCVLQQKRVSRLMAIEESAGVTVAGHKEIQLLAKIAEAVMNHQSKSAKMKWKDNAHEMNSSALVMGVMVAIFVVIASSTARLYSGPKRDLSLWLR
jgi:hypothetical protein